MLDTNPVTPLDKVTLPAVKCLMVAYKEIHWDRVQLHSWFAKPSVGSNSAVNLELLFTESQHTKATFYTSPVPYHAIQVTVLLLRVFVDVQRQLHRDETGINNLQCTENRTHVVLVKLKCTSEKQAPAFPLHTQRLAPSRKQDSHFGFALLNFFSSENKAGLPKTVTSVNGDTTAGTESSLL